MKRTKHNLSNYRLTTSHMGTLLPVQAQEVLPGDTMNIESSALVRLSPMLAPVMHPVTIRLHHWFVPYRLLWDQFEDFITGNDDTISPPIITVDGTQSQPLLGHLGVTSPDSGTYDVNAFNVRAYNLIYNEFYRDQDLVAERTLDKVDSLANVAWRKDYFTAARPWAQKGEEIVLPIGNSAPVTRDPAFGDTWLQDVEAHDSRYLFGASQQVLHDTTVTETTPAHIKDGYLTADLSQATGVTATEFREFFALQRYQEARARYGSRYTEYLRYLGVRPSDARLQRPEYVGGGKSTVQISEVLQTAYEPDTPVGTLRGHGISALRSRRSKKFFEEHGVLMTLMSVVPKSIYHDGTPRQYFRKTKEDFFQKELQNIGQQPILQGEVYSRDSANVENVFGYQDRYSCYGFTPSHVAGQFRSTLDFWHMARKFDTPPNLNEEFITCSPTRRIFADQVDDPLWIMVNNKVVARRMVRKTAIGRIM